MKIALAIALLTAAAGMAHGQIVLNEVYPNPPGSGSIDDRWEYIEVYGPAGMNLTGYLIASVYGGANQNGNALPGPLPSGWDVGDDVAEIDEAWTLDGLTIGSNGLLVIYNNARVGQGQPSFDPSFFSPGTAGATFLAAHCPTTDVAGRIKNDGSATFVLVRKRPYHALNAAGQSLYDGALNPPSGAGYPSNIRYAWRKDVNPDVDFDGKTDLNGIGTMLIGGAAVPPETGVNSENAATPAVGGPKFMEPYQMVDDVSWSNAGGKEYTRSPQQKISDTPTFNPDALSRIHYYGSNPHAGSVYANGVMTQTSTADEEFIYGDMGPTAPLVSYQMVDPSTLQPTIGGPTDPLGPKYDGTGQPNAAGTYLLNDINMTGFKLTPGGFNDVNSTGVGGSNIVQFRFVTGDFNFDGVVDCADKALMEARMAANASLDETEVKVRENGTPADPSDDVQYANGWKWQGRDFNGLLAMVRMSLTDGTTGEWNSGFTVTQADYQAFLAVLPVVCVPPVCSAADVGVQGGTAGHDRLLDNNDFVVFISLFFASDPIADMGVQGGTAGHDTLWDNNDFVMFINYFFNDQANCTG